MSNDKKSVVITGGNGFVGRHLVRELGGDDPDTRLVVWDRQIDGLPDGVEGLTVDVTQPESYRQSLQEAQPAWVVHLAAVPSAALAAQDEALAYRVNVEGTRQLLEEVERLGSDTKVLCVSTADIYGQGSTTPLPELPLEEALPRNPYAESKWKMERVVERYFNERVIRVRPFPHIGPGQALGYVTADFASQVAAIESGRQEPVMKVGNLEAKRDFTDVRDVVRAYRMLMSDGELGQVYHVASEVAVSIRSILDKLLSMSKVRIVIEQDPDRLRSSDVPVLVGDAGKLRRATRWQPTVLLDQSLRDILDWWRERVTVAQVPGRA